MKSIKKLPGTEYYIAVTFISTMFALMRICFNSGAASAETFQLKSDAGGNFCLTAESNEVHMRDCRNSEDQKFLYQNERFIPKMQPDKCLDIEGGAGWLGSPKNVVLWPCKAGFPNNEKWYKSGAQIKSRDSNMWIDVCLDTNEGKNRPTARACDNRWNSMRWSWIAVSDPSPPPLPPPPAAQGCSYIFVPGLNAKADMWDSPSSKQDLNDLKYPAHADTFSSLYNLDFDAQANELSGWVDKVLTSDKTSKVVLIGHSMGGIASIRYAEKAQSKKVAAIITLDSPLLGTPIAELKQNSAATGKFLFSASPLCTVFGGGGVLVCDGLAGVVSGVANYASWADGVPPDALAVGLLRTDSKALQGLGQDLNKLSGKGLYIHSIVVGSDGVLTSNGWADGDGIVPTFSQSIINLKNKYAPVADFATGQTRVKQYEAYTTLDQIHNTSQHDKEVMTAVMQAIQSPAICNQCGNCPNSRNVQTLPVQAVETGLQGLHVENRFASNAVRRGQKIDFLVSGIASPPLNMSLYITGDSKYSAVIPQNTIQRDPNTKLVKASFQLPQDLPVGPLTANVLVPVRSRDAGKKLYAASDNIALKAASGNGGLCSDFWVTEALVAAGVTPDSGNSGNCNINRYGAGHWNDKQELTTRVEKSLICQDPWIGQVFFYTFGRDPKGSGTSGECNPRLYGNGSWTSYPDLTAKIKIAINPVKRGSGFRDL